jgi:hypothetical protein
MKKQFFIIAAAALGLASCSSEEDMTDGGHNGSLSANALIIRTDSTMTETREAMNYDLTHKWSDGDHMGVFASWNDGSDVKKIGVDNADYTYNASYTYGGITYTNVFTQADASKGAVDWQASDKPHFFYMYFPRDENASVNSVNFTLSNSQTQTTANVWSNPASGSYNFIWNNILNATQPYDHTIPFYCHRLLPVAEFNIVRDDNKLDDFNLTGITMTPESGTMATGATTIDLTTLSSCSSLNFTGTPVANYSLDTKGTGDGIKVADANVTAGHSFSVYMSVPPAASNKYTLQATFTNGTDTKLVTLNDVSDAFTINKGKGSLTRYYFNASAAKDKGAEGVNEGVDGEYYRWDAAAVFGATSNSTNVAANICKQCPTRKQIWMYLNASIGIWWGKGPVGTKYASTNGLWIPFKKYISGFDDGTANSSTNVVNLTDRQWVNCTEDKSKFFFLPANGYYDQNSPAVSGEGAPEVPTNCFYWSRDAEAGKDAQAYCLQCTGNDVNVVSTNRNNGLGVWCVQ